jgi:hypothetical protein
MIYVKLPEYVVPCGVCHGTGEYEQTYTAGCGGGYYKSLGKCEYCAREGEYSMTGVGYVYKDDDRWRNAGVPKSVMEQIKRMNVRTAETDDV